jgi:hypothetical protein
VRAGLFSPCRSSFPLKRYHYYAKHVSVLWCAHECINNVSRFLVTCESEKKCRFCLSICKKKPRKMKIFFFFALEMKPIWDFSSRAHGICQVLRSTFIGLVLIGISPLSQIYRHVISYLSISMHDLEMIIQPILSGNGDVIIVIINQLLRM